LNKILISHPEVVLKIIDNFEGNLQNSNEYLPVEKKQLESVMSIAKSSVQYWAYGSGHFKAGLATDVYVPEWVDRDIAGAGGSLLSGTAVTAATFLGPWGYFGAILGTAAIASMI
jgi:hypothetical protein